MLINAEYPKCFQNNMNKINQNLKLKCNPKVFIEASKFFFFVQVGAGYH